METSKEELKIYVRVRPFLERELRTGSDFPITDISETKKDLHVYEFVVNALKSHSEIRDMLKNPKYYQVHNFAFDHVFDEKSSQDEVYQVTSQKSIDFFLKGYNATILAYGQTGTGKTHTIEGSANEPGIVYRVLEDVLKLTKSMKKTKLSASYLQIYNENLSDLLTEKNTKTLDMKKDKQSGVYVENLTEKSIDSLDQAYQIIKQGSNMRFTAKTMSNDQSSRSHAVFILKLERSVSPKETVVSRLYLVDLAGSERITISGVSGTRLEEAKKINTSLSELSNVILSLSKPGNAYVTFRNSKLTRLLENSLGGNSFTSLIATVSPSHECLSETLSTLKFASRAKKIKNTVSINKVKANDGHLKILQKYNNGLKKLKTQDPNSAIEMSQLDDLDNILDSKQPKSEYDNELLAYDYNNKEEEDRLELYKEMLMNQREVLIQLTNKLNGKNAEVATLKRKLQDKQGSRDSGNEALKVVKKKIDKIVESLSQKDASIDLQAIAEDLLYLQSICSKNVN